MSLNFSTAVKAEDENVPPPPQGIWTQNSFVTVNGKRLFVPSYLPVQRFGSYLYWSAYLTDSDYWVNFDFDQKCYGHRTCNFAAYSTEHLSLDVAQRLDTLFEDANLREIDLWEKAPFITGYFLPGTCGANCSQSSLIWIYKDRLFHIQSVFFPEKRNLAEYKKSAQSILIHYLPSNSVKNKKF